MVFTIIYHDVRQQYGISNNDYCVADLIDLLSNNPDSPVKGWCNMSRTNIGKNANISRRSVVEIVKDLEAKKLVERDTETDYLRTTSLWKESVHRARIRANYPDQQPNTDSKGVQKLHTNDSAETAHPVQKLHTSCAETAHDDCAVSAHNIYKLDSQIDNVCLSTDAQTQNDEQQQNLDAEQGPPPPPVAQPPAPSIPRRTYGDGELYKKVAKFWRENPDKYDPEMYVEFLENWTEIVQSDNDHPENVGKELWRTHTVFPLAKRLEKWLPGYNNDKERKTRESTSNNTNAGSGSGGRSKGGYKKPSKRTPAITPDILTRNRATGRDTDQDSQPTTVVIDVD